MTQTPEQIWRTDIEAAKDHDGWVIFADIHLADGSIILASSDVYLSDMRVWYIGTDLSQWTHWKPLRGAK